MKFTNNKAVSMIEYLVLVLIIIGAFLVMNHNIMHGLFGTWANSGQSFAFGRQYDAQKTIECSFDGVSNRWYDRNCYEYYINKNQCNGDPTCEENIITGTDCSASSCKTLNNAALTGAP